MLFLILATCIKSFDSGVTATGLSMFSSITALNIFFITILGISMFSTVITEEKEVNALNLLLMTGITPFALIFSKSFSKLLIGSMFLLVQVPFTFLAVTLGGISLTQIVAVYVSLFAYTFLICYISLFASVISRTSFEAAFVAFLFFLVILFIPWGFIDVTPIKSVSSILTNTYSGGVIGRQFLSDIVLGLCFFVASLALFNYCSRRQAVRGEGHSLFGRRCGGSGVFKVGRCWNDCVTWKDFHFFSGGAKGLVFRSLLLIITIAILDGVHYFDTGTFVFMHFIDFVFFTSSAFLVIDLISFAAKVFRSEINGKTLPVLMVLPHSVKRIFYMKVLSHIPALIPYCVCLVCCSIIYIDKLFDSQFMSVFISFVFIFILYLHLVIFFSLYFRYGAFAIALVVLAIVGSCLIVPVMYGVVILVAILSFFDSALTSAVAPLAGCLAIALTCMLILFLIQTLAFNRIKHLAAQ
jgi:hypothetical protein